MKVLETLKYRWLQDTPQLWAKIRDLSGVITLVLTTAITGVTAAGLVSNLPTWLILISSIGIFISGALTTFAGTRIIDKNKSDVTIK